MNEINKGNGVNQSIEPVLAEHTPAPLLGLDQAVSSRRRPVANLAIATIAAAVGGLAVVWMTGISVAADDAYSELRKPSSWNAPPIERVVEGFGTWLSDHRDDTRQHIASAAFLKQALARVTLSQRLDAIVNAISIVRPDVGTFVNQLKQREKDPNGILVNDFQYDIDSAIENDFVQHHVRLFYGRWLAQNRFYDESLTQLDQVEIETVLDPATLLYYRSLMQHQLLLKDQCLETAKKLLENENDIPRRYAAIGKLMIADLEPLETDSLDEISRLMNDVGRRTALRRAGNRVIDQEKQVIQKLDKLIEDLQQQQQQQQQSKSSSRSQQPPSGPIRASQVAGSGATGEAGNKRQTDGGDWGDLPPAQRAAAMAEMSKEMPPHYRAVIEEYFRRLAQE